MRPMVSPTRRRRRVEALSSPLAHRWSGSQPILLVVGAILLVVGAGWQNHGACALIGAVHGPAGAVWRGHRSRYARQGHVVVVADRLGG
jgi:hypothetical protein